jgi:hypothetical protein
MPREIIAERHRSWEELLNKRFETILFQQWPEPGSTSTGGWLETNWTQNDPYNQLCPLDPVTGARSIAGCPAIAMGQIVNFYQTTNDIHFTDADDYYHNYAGRQYWIDDDCLTEDFPSFPELNDILDTVNVRYHQSIPLSDNEKAAVVFACGAAAQQVYTSSGSGTFGVTQAYDAYLKFNFTAIQLLHDTDTNLYTRMAQNIMDTMPVHLAVVDEGWTMGHNVVVDGYNTDNYFHLNFGWGGPSNGWYLLPDEIPYGLTVIEGAIVDILPDDHTGITWLSTSEMEIYPNPSSGLVIIRMNFSESVKVSLYSITGKLLHSFVLEGQEHSIDLSGLMNGVYVVQLQTKDHIFTSKIIIQL